MRFVKFDKLEIVMKKHLRIVAVFLLVIVMMVGMTFVSSAEGDAKEDSFGDSEFITAEELTPVRITLLVVAAISLVIALCIKPVDRWRHLFSP